MTIFPLSKLPNRLLNEFEFRLQRRCLRSMPVTIDVVLTKACNLACTFCKDYETEGAQRISLSNFERIAAQLFPTATGLSICSGGEPYLHRGLEEILRIGKRYRLYTWLLSNGMLAKPDRVRPMVRERLISRHGFSVDGYRAATVEALRVNARLEVILENIRNLIRIREEEGQEEPRITIRYALMRSNVEELPDAVRQWGELGVDRLDCDYLSLANDMERDESLFFHQELLEKVMGEGRAVAAHYPKLRVSFPELIREQAWKKERPVRCRAPWSFVYIDTNGEVKPCYAAFEALKMGKVYDDDGVSFAAVWNSPEYQSLRATVNHGSAEKFFGYCGVCESRYGWSDRATHLGDETWIATLAKSGGGLVNIDHRRGKSKAPKAGPG